MSDSKDIPKYGDEVSYVIEDGETVAGKVIGVDDYESYMIVTIRQHDGSLYGAKLKKNMEAL